MFSNAMTMRVMANKYHRLAEQEIPPQQRDKYRAYARIYSQMALSALRRADARSLVAQ